MMLLWSVSIRLSTHFTVLNSKGVLVRKTSNMLFPLVGFLTSWDSDNWCIKVFSLSWFISPAKITRQPGLLVSKVSSPSDKCSISSSGYSITNKVNSYFLSNQDPAYKYEQAFAILPLQLPFWFSFDRCNRCVSGSNGKGTTLTDRWSLHSWICVILWPAWCTAKLHWSISWTTCHWYWERIYWR